MGLLEKFNHLRETFGSRKVAYLVGILHETRDFAKSIRADGEFTDGEAEALGELIHSVSQPILPNPDKLTKDKLAELVKWANQGRKLVWELF